MQAICVPIFVYDVPSTLAAMREAVADGATLVELRCDTTRLAVMEEVLRLREGVRLADGEGGGRVPVIVTIRPVWEGGFYDGDEQQRISLFEHAGLAGAEFMDVELAAWKRSANLRQKVMLVCGHPQGKDDGGRERTCRLIVSSHDFDGRPADLEGRIAELRAVEQAAILKIAWKARSIQCGIDALRLMQAAGDGRPLLALAMGEAGLLSRVLSGKCGAPLTFGTTALAPGSAPGQPTVRDLARMYRWGGQRPGQPTYAVAGFPIGHSLSPAIHNAGLDEAGLAGTYVPLLIAPEYEAFRTAIDGLRAIAGMNLRGVSVTIPHKENAMRYARENGAEIDGLSEHIGVVNTLAWRGKDERRETKDESLVATNSDYAGAVDALAGALGGSREILAGKRVAVLGAGGAARAIVAAMANYGATTVVYNRTAEKARQLAAEFDGSGAGEGKVVGMPLEALAKSCCDIVINCTPLGMYPRMEASPVEFDPAWDGQTVVFDTIYNPLMTRLLQTAQAKGARIVTGAEMFVRQAAVQFELFTGVAAPVEVFRRVMRERLER